MKEEPIERDIPAILGYLAAREGTARKYAVPVYVSAGELIKLLQRSIAVLERLTADNPPKEAFEEAKRVLEDYRRRTVEGKRG